ncbi:hypothetical protein BSPA111_08080 [Buttiauxella sp. A111]|nr:hypothetical protein BSPA111_08080 [Buttiauxella sp. A111]
MPLIPAFSLREKEITELFLLSVEEITELFPLSVQKIAELFPLLRERARVRAIYPPNPIK